MFTRPRALVLLHPVFPWEGDRVDWLGTIILLFFALLVLGAAGGAIYLVIKTLKKLL
jgi:hypothetical protein